MPTLEFTLPLVIHSHMLIEHGIMHENSIECSSTLFIETHLQGLIRKITFAICMLIPWLQHVTCMTLGTLALLAPGLQPRCIALSFPSCIHGQGYQEHLQEAKYHGAEEERLQEAKCLGDEEALWSNRFLKGAKPEHSGAHQHLPPPHIVMLRWLMFKTIRRSTRSGYGASINDFFLVAPPT